MTVPFRDFSDDPMRRGEILLANLRAARRQMRQAAMFAFVALLINLAVCAMNVAFAFGWLSR
jgi:hypothetical protein